MTTLARLLADRDFTLRLGSPEQAEIYRTRPVTGLWPAGSNPPPQGWRHVLAVIGDDVDPAAYEQFVRAAAQGGAAGIASGDSASAGLIEAGLRHRIPVLLTPEHQPWLRLAHRLAELGRREEREETRSIQELISRTRQLGDCSQTAEGVLRWLASTIEGVVRLIDPHEPPRELEEGLTVPADRLAALIASPRPAVDAYSSGGWSVRMFTIGPTAPRHVLLAARRGESWDAAANESVRLTTECLDWWLRMRDGSEAAYEHVRESVLQLLMGGHVVLAQRVAHPLSLAAHLMDADAARVYIVSGPPSRRHMLAAELHHRLESAAIVVRCPVARRQTIVVCTDSAAADTAIREVVRDSAEYCVGASRPAPLSEVGACHEQATRALGPAELAADRYALYTAETDIAQVLPRDAAWRWASSLLGPLAPSRAWPTARREEWLWTIHLWLTYGTRGAVHLTGSHRNTPRRRAATLSQLLGLDLENSLADRIQLDLAMRIDRLHPSLPPPPGEAPRSWLDLLESEGVRAWGAEFIARVDPALLETLTTWIACGQHRETTAAALGIAPRTVPGRLARAEAQIRRPLVSFPTPGTRPHSANGVSGVHDLALALYATGQGAAIGLDVRPSAESRVSRVGDNR